MVDLSKIMAGRMVRDSVHNLVVHEVTESENVAYFARIKYFFEVIEGSRNWAYLDGIPDPDTIPVQGAPSD